MLDITAARVKIGAMNQSCASRLPMFGRTLCVAAGALVIWFSSGVDAMAGVIVASGAALGEMSAPDVSANRPAVPKPAVPLVRDLNQAPLLLTSATNTGGAGSQSTTNGPNAGLVALVSEVAATSQNSLVSRLVPFSRVSLPSPLEDRFFRPPRMCN